jgi:hypothetical protein
MPVRIPGAAAALVLATALLSACESRPPGPFRLVDGVWHWRDARIPDADVRTFVPLDDHYAKDARRVVHASSSRDAREYFAIRHDRVAVLEGADPATFVVLGGGYARDARTAYHEGERFAVRDAASLVRLSYAFVRDDVRGYCHQAEVPGSDGRTFEVVDAHHAKDRSGVYHCRVLLEANAPVRIVRLPDADPPTFRVLDDGYALDARRAYHAGRAVGEAEGFRALGFQYAATRSAILHDGVPVAGADAATFRVTPATIAEGIDAEDVRFRYRGGARVGPR